jgi:CIC family chloride channel protein
MNFYGLVKMDDIRQIMFNTELYQTTKVRNLMFMPRFTISKDESMAEVARKFQISGRFNIVVLENGKYVGFVSRAKIFSAYREIMRDISDE